MPGKTPGTFFLFYAVLKAVAERGRSPISPEEKVSAATRARIGLIGAGWWATSNHLPVLQRREDVDLVAVCRLGAEELQQVKSRFGFDYATEDYVELLEHCELDGVIVASPHTLHYEHAKAALEKNLHNV